MGATIAAACIFILGAVFGSFLNVCIYRIPKGMSVVAPRSFCSACGHELGALDLVPVLSFLLLRGKCRYCGVRFSAENALVELLSAFAVTALYLRLGLTLWFAACALFALCLITIAFIDFRHKVIPNKIIVVLLVIALASQFIVFDTESLLVHVLAFVGYGAFFYLVALLTKGGFGGGDIKLIAVTALLLGIKPMFYAVFIAAFSASLVYGTLIVLKKRKLSDYVAFGPFICLGAYIAMLI